MKARTSVVLAIVALGCLVVVGMAAAQGPVTDGLAAWFIADSGLVKADGTPCAEGEGARRWWSTNDPVNLQVAHSSLFDNGAFHAAALNGHATYEFIPLTTAWGQDEGSNLFPANDPPDYTIYVVVKDWVQGCLVRITGYNGASYHSRESVAINRGAGAPDLPFMLRHTDDAGTPDPPKGFRIEDTNTWELAAAPHIVEAVAATEAVSGETYYRGLLESSDLTLDGVAAAGLREYYIDPVTQLPREPRIFHVSGRNLQLGYGDDSWSGWLDGQLAEVLVYTRALDACERAETGLYLADKYGITTSFQLCSACPGDVNGNLEVDPDDLNRVLNAYGSFEGDPNWDADADLNGNGEVDPDDLNTVLNNYGNICF